jgi:hypothetical protein
MSPPRMTRNGDAFDRALLRAGRNDGPPLGAEERALAGLGLSAVVVRSAGVMRPEVLARGLWGWPLKAAAVVLALSALVGVVVASVRPGAAGAPVPATVGVAYAPEPVVPVVPEATLAESNAARVDAAPVVAPSGEPPRAAGHLALPVPSGVRSAGAGTGATGTGARATAASAKPTTSGAPPLSVEIALVQQAARALASGDAEVAMDLLDTYRRDCPRGVLAEEASALRVQALVQTGHAAEAKALAQRLVAAHPDGVLASRLRGVLEGAR